MTTTTRPSTVTSADGTTIGVSAIGSGPAVVLVDGALCHRGMGPAAKLADALQDRFTVYTYDRRGRGESADTAPYSPQREIEDLAAVIELAGGSADVYGVSSGAVVALDAARQDIGIRRLAVYEAPLFTNDSRAAAPDDLPQRMESLVREGRRSDAVQLFMRVVEVPGVFIRLMRLMPVWRQLKAVAHTLTYDFQFLDGLQDGKPLPAGRWTTVSAPVLVMAGGKSPEWMQQGNRELSSVLPSSAQIRILPGQTHMLKARAVAPALTEFFS